MVPRTPTVEQLERLRITFRERPPTSSTDLSAFASAAARAQCTEAAARRAWFTGWPSDGITPLSSESAATPERQRAAAVATVRAEVIARGVSARAHALGDQIDRLDGFLVRLVGRLEAADVGDVAPGAALAAIRTLIATHREVGALARNAVELEKLVDGEPQRIVGRVDVSPSAPVDLAAARAEAEALLRAVRHAEGAKQLASTKDDDGTVH